MSKNDRYVILGFVILISLLAVLIAAISSIKERIPSLTGQAQQNLFFNADDQLLNISSYVQSGSVVNFDYFTPIQSKLYDMEVTDSISALTFLASDPKVQVNDVYPISTVKKILQDKPENFSLFDSFSTNEQNGNGDHYFFHQKLCNGIEVYNSLLAIHTNGNDEVYGISGNYLTSEPSTCQESITIAQAQEIVQMQYANNNTNPPTITFKNMYIYNPKLNGQDQDKNYLVYHINACIDDKCSSFFVDSQSGDIIKSQLLTIQALNRHVFSSGGVVRNEGDAPVSNQNINNIYDILGTTYNYYSSKHNRDSLNGNGERLNAYYCGSGCMAAWDAENAVIYVGTGFVKTDVIAHEYTHGVSQRIVGGDGLDYPDPRGPDCNCDQASSLNEALSDIFACAVDGNWTLGEGTSYGVFRNLSNPTGIPRSKGGPLPDKLFSPYYKCDEGSDYEHLNSSIFGHAVYLMADGGNFNGCNITAIGRDKAFASVYEGLKKYLVGKNSANYLDMYNAVNQGCSDLYGANSADCNSVKAAMQSAEMDQQPAGQARGAKCLGRTASPATCLGSSPNPTSSLTSTPGSSPVPTSTTPQPTVNPSISPSPTVVGVSPSVTPKPTDIPMDAYPRVFKGKIHSLYPNTTVKGDVIITCAGGQSELFANVNMTGYLDIFKYTYEGRLFGVDIKKTGLLRLEMDEKTKGTAMVNHYTEDTNLCNFRGYEIVQIDSLYKKEVVAFVAVLDEVIVKGVPPLPNPDPSRIYFKVKARYQGINKKPSAGVEWLVARVGYDNPDMEEPLYVHMPFYVDSFGVWWSYWSFDEAQFPLDLSKQFTFKIKGPKHAQKKICDNFMTESEPGAYFCDIGKMTINDDVNHYDLYGITQLAGDVNQDGIINGMDVALIRNNFNTKDINTLLWIDLNLDGVVNSIDDAMVVQALRVRTDEN